MCGGPKLPDPVKPTPPPSKSDAQIQQAANQKKVAALKKTGLTSTILTSSQGLLDDPKTQKTLLGV